MINLNLRSLFGQSLFVPNIFNLQLSWSRILRVYFQLVEENQKRNPQSKQEISNQS